MVESMETRSKSKKQKIIVEPRLKPIKYKLNDVNFNKISKTKVKTINDQQFFNFEDNPLNKRGYKYKPCKPNKLFKSTLYSTTDIPPYDVRPSYFDKSQGIIFGDENNIVSNRENGWRSIRSNIGVREGDWYVEFNIIKSGNDDHVRLGFARREASLEAPIGFDGYGYGVRDVTGQKITLSRPKSFMNEPIVQGDVIGFRIILPNLSTHKLVNNEVSLPHDPDDDNDLNQHNNLIRDQVPIKYKSSLFFEQFEYTKTEKMSQLLNPVKIFGEKLTKLEKLESINLPIIPESKIIVYKNGVEMGTMFDNLYSFLPFKNNLSQSSNSNFKNTDDGSLAYYPMISIYNNAIVEMVSNPTLVPQGSRPISERYDDVVVESMVWDIIDEVESNYLDHLEAQQPE